MYWDNYSDVNFLVGVNGSGKSRLLNTIGQNHLKRNDHVIAISNTVFDKFSTRGYEKLSARDGEVFLKNIIIDSFLNENDSIYNILEYLKYERFVAVLISFYADFDGDFLSYFIRKIDKYNKFDIPIDKDFIDYELIELKKFCNQLEKLLRPYSNYEYIFDFGYWMGKENTVNLSIFKKFYELFSNKRIFKIDFLLSKDGKRFKLDGASSGESHFLAQMLFLSEKILKNKKNIILIDEPEISLHPKWQREYVLKLYDYFYMYDLNFFIATHSPLMISKLQVNRKDFYSDYIGNINYKIFKVIDGDFERIQEDDDYSIESLYWEIFGLLTPDNSFLSRYCVALLDNYDLKKISFYEIKEEFKKLKEACDLDLQKQVLMDIENRFINNNEH
ncbi:UNVERIFIED_CONTAM: ATP-binding protein [Acinetobacter baumannii]|uniref:AAA family ATPase n=1 Tax=Acinetobacter baumannii TaxID=470 RepID=UPI0025A2A6A8|nr:AAA family ATPase [Acinetobacter baumannii]MCZ3029083.1 ATP-binding protein [Acinetobacter baumannii]MDQ9836724.1 AAA family ATPase [Acinetobacter baumannii]HEE6601716.1 ATP-binding protein [Acinetobacter baumannii]